jgi:hypothetical protein
MDLGSSEANEVLRSEALQDKMEEVQEDYRKNLPKERLPFLGWEVTLW